MTTLSIIKAGTGGFVGHSDVHPLMLQAAEAAASDAVSSELLTDAKVARCGDDVALIMTHGHGVDAEPVHAFAWETFQDTIRVARRLGLTGTGPAPLADSFGGTLRGTGPAVAEVEFTERPSEPVVCLLADKTDPGAWNLALYKMFADPFNTAGLVLDSSMRAGFRFEVYDLYHEKRIVFDTPEDLYDLLMFIGAPARYVVHRIESRRLGIQAAVTSAQRLSLNDSRYVGRDDPVLIVRCETGLPSVGEVLEPFSFPYTVAGCLRGSHHAPIMPVGLAQATPVRSDGPPRVIALGYQVRQGKLIGPRDLFTDPSFDRARAQAVEAMDYLRRHGPFEPHRLALEDLENSEADTVHQVEDETADRWRPIGTANPLLPQH